MGDTGPPPTSHKPSDAEEEDMDGTTGRVTASQDRLRSDVHVDLGGRFVAVLADRLGAGQRGPVDPDPDLAAGILTALTMILFGLVLALVIL
jgi:hypothetical protein